MIALFNPFVPSAVEGRWVHAERVSTALDTNGFDVSSEIVS
jgi:hypothetical protein